MPVSRERDCEVCIFYGITTEICKLAVQGWLASAKTDAQATIVVQLMEQRSNVPEL